MLFLFFFKYFRFESPYKSTCNTALDSRHLKADSPRSTRSAPWSQPHSRGLYNVSVPPSPRSIHSAGPRYRSSSVDSQSSNDSRSCKRLVIFHINKYIILNMIFLGGVIIEIVGSQIMKVNFQNVLVDPIESTENIILEENTILVQIKI